MRNQRITFHVSRFTLLILCVLLLTSCLPPLPRTVKIGLVAPFEGRYRYVGYDAIYAARLAVREINAAGGAGGRLLELVAYDDRGAPELAQTVARNLVVDPDVIAVIGHFRQASTEAAVPVYAEAGLPLVVIAARLYPAAGLWQLASPDIAIATGGPELAEGESGILTPYPLPQDVPVTEAWRDAYLSIGPHVAPPGAYTLPTYEAVYLLAAALDAGIATREGVSAALPGIERDGLLGRIAWNAEGFWANAPVYRYRWEDGVPVLGEK